MKIAIMGFGTVGSGVYEVLKTNHRQIAQKAGKEISVKYILDLRDFPETEFADKIIHDFSVIEQDPEIEIVVETMGGLTPAYSFVKASLEAGKHVATSNKALVAAHGTELLAIARKKRVNFMFEASVGGGIPIIRTLYRSLMGEQIEEITGILNGTTNFILTKMEKEGVSFECALKEAQALGYAERNPEADVEGHDTCRKIAILTAMATGKEVRYEDIYTEGITGITETDFRYADMLGASVKLFGSSRMKHGRVYSWVAPLMIGKDHPLYSISGVYNGILVRGNMVGTTMYYGSGAGKLPTASAVVSDMIEEARFSQEHVEMGWSEERLAVAPVEEDRYGYFVRISGSLEQTKTLVEAKLNVHRFLELDNMDEYAILTGEMQEGDFKKAAEELERDLRACTGKEILQRIRTEL